MEQKEAHRVTMRDFVDAWVRTVVSNPSLVCVDDLSNEEQTTIQITCLQADSGRVIGQGGARLHAIRTLLQSMNQSSRQVRVTLNTVKAWGTDHPDERKGEICGPLNIIACTDISICTDQNDGRHAGIGIAYYDTAVSDERLFHEISDHQPVANETAQEMEWCAIRRALQEVSKWGQNQASIAICSDCAEAVVRWRSSAGYSPSKRKKVFSVLDARCMTVMFHHVEREMILRAHLLARRAAYSRIATPQAQNTVCQLTELLKAQTPCLGS